MFRPAVKLIFAYIAGIMGGFFFDVPVIALIVAALAMLFLTIYNQIGSWQKDGIYFYVLIAIMGVSLFYWQTARNEGNISDLANQEVVLHGVIVEEPDLRFNSINYTVKLVEELTGKIGEKEIKGKILITVKSPNQRYSYGDMLEIKGTPELPKSPGNPGDFDYQKYLRSKGIQLVVKSWGGTGIQQLGTGEFNPLVSLGLWCKQKLVKVMRETLSERHSGIMEGLIFGSVGLIDDTIKEEFALTGLVHILSVSGFHMGLIAGICIMMAGIFKLTRLLRIIFIFGATLFYAVMTGADPPVIRAMVMVWVLVLAQSIDQKYDWPSALSLAAFLILVFSPNSLFAPGFQLSFVATWGIMYLAPAIRRVFLFLPPAPAQAVSVVLSAQLAVFPITSYYFSYQSMVSIPANLIAIFPISLVIYLGGMASIAGLIWLPLAEVINVSAGLILEGILKITSFLASLPFAVITVKKPPLIGIAIFYLCIILITEGFRNPEWRVKLLRFWSLHKPKVIIAIIIFSALIIWYDIIFPEQKELQVTFIDIGQGDAALIETPGGRNIIIDTGGAKKIGSSGYDPGKKVLLPFLRRKGIKDIELLILSHPHADHIQGADAIIKWIPVKQLGIVPQFLSYPDGAVIAGRFQKEGTEILQVCGGEEIDFGEDITLEIFSPARGEPVEENNDSMICLLNYKEFQILFTGDAEKRELEPLSLKLAGTSADIVKIPHHGSKNSWVEKFYRQLNPELAVVSVGPNQFGHPSGEVLDGLDMLGIRVLRTDRDGAVIVRSDGYKFSVETGRSMHLE